MVLTYHKPRHRVPQVSPARPMLAILYDETGKKKPARRDRYLLGAGRGGADPAGVVARS